jgi:phosphoribosylformimino-5-aminoimidazole carboxamide ribotide isomerase
MLLIPVMELKHGHSVHTHHAPEGNEVVTEDPMAVAERWVSAGAKRIHVVDVDGVQARQPVNSHIISAIKKRYPELEFQIGGVSREDDILVWLDAGANYMVMNSRAILRTDFVAEMCVEYPNHIMAALDSHNGEVRFSGRDVSFDLVTIAKQLDNDGVSAIILTDIPDSGHVNCCNITASCNLASELEIPVIANGGISCLEDLEGLERADEHRLGGIIIGKPLHDQQLDFCEAQACVVNL